MADGGDYSRGQAKLVELVILIKGIFMGIDSGMYSSRNWRFSGEVFR